MIKLFKYIQSEKGLLTRRLEEGLDTEDRANFIYPSVRLTFGQPFEHLYIYILGAVTHECK